MTGAVSGSGYVVYGHRRSGSCAVELALAEAGASWEVREVDLDTEGQRAGDYLALNPQGKIPALVTPDGQLLTESVAILLTLAERHPDAGLLPAPGSAARATALRWLAFVASELYPVVEINDYPERFSPRRDLDQEVRGIARAMWRERWLRVEREIAGGPFLLGGQCCLTDLYIAVVSRWAQQEAWRPAHLPRVEGIVAAVASRPALAAVWARHFGAPDASRGPLRQP